jgi:hypothetical protein
MSSHFVIEKKGIKYTVSCVITQVNKAQVFVNGSIVGEFTKLGDEYETKALGDSECVQKDTFRRAEQYILDQHFNLLRNARGVFKKPLRTKRRICALV